MAQMKRTPFERERDYERITRWYIRGDTQTEIAARLGLSQKQISYDLNTIRQRWRKETTFNLDEHKQRELARIDEAEREYWQAWERSKKRKTKQVREMPGDGSRFVVERGQCDGNPAFLAGVMACIDRRCKLLGLDAPSKQELTGKDGGPIEYNDMSDANSRIMGRLAQLAARTGTQEAINGDSADRARESSA